MKKIVLSIIGVALVIGVAVAVFIHTSRGEEKQSLKPIDDPVFVYVNLEQLATKGAFDKFITPENRSFIATVLSSLFEKTEDAEHIKNIVTNLNAIGIDTKQSIYGYVNDDLTDCVLMANVSNVVQLDRSVALLSYILEQNGEETIAVTTENDMRTFEYDDLFVAYNTSALAVAVGEGDDVMGVAIDAINRPQMDISLFGASDMAVLINTEKCLQMASAKVDRAILDLNKMYNTGEIDEEMLCAQSEALAENQELIDSYMSYFAPNSNVMLSATFDLGRMTLAYNTQGVSFGEYAGISKPTNAEHLSYLGKDSFMVMSAGVDGKLLAQLIRTLLDGNMLESVGVTPTNEVNMVISIVCDALSTINGGTTLALENIEGEIKQRYNYYWDEYNIEPSIDTVKAMLMMDVTDTYIISNIAQFAGGFLNKRDATHYSLSLMGYNFSMGQDENLFHLGVNMTPEVQTPSALDSAWAKDVDGALGFIAIDVDSLILGKFMQSANKYIALQLLEEYRELYSNAIEAVSYVYASVDSLESAEFVVVFDNKEANALEQINALVLPTLVKECVKSLY